MRSVSEINQIASDKYHGEIIQKRSSILYSPLNGRKRTSELEEKDTRTPDLRYTFEPDDSLDQQVMARTQGAKNVAALLHALEAQKADERRIYMAESEDIERKLSSIGRRLDTAQSNSECRLQQRIVAASQAGRASETARRIGSEFRRYEVDREAQYAVKVEKIRSSKVLREKLLKEVVARKEEEYRKRKQAQLENYKKLQETITAKERKMQPEPKFFQVIHQ
eukprot:TRINITY_DN2411_c0_g1_i9.p1 TRINITY_DN2411_c0_g1~~TRINITY_DN2411_c0_g1_i9.p1  ORF type:complete len:223 (+),score=81.71 TRINITY_DN2411_c0_g1_i9:749-1417(+)